MKRELKDGTKVCSGSCVTFYKCDTAVLVSLYHMHRQIPMYLSVSLDSFKKYENREGQYSSVSEERNNGIQRHRKIHCLSFVLFSFPLQSPEVGGAEQSEIGQ